MNKIKNQLEIKAMRAGGRVLANALQQVAAAVRPGITTDELNTLAERLVREQGATPSFLGYGHEMGTPFPATLCTSVNNAVVHGIPSKKAVLQAGQIIGLDLGCWYEGFCTDMAVTVSVGQASPAARKLIKVTEAALNEGLRYVRAGGRVGDIGHAVQSFVEAHGFSVVRQLTGHGVGRAVHEEPSVPNFGKPGTGARLDAGMTIAVEPMVNAGSAEVDTLDDGWTVVTADGGLSAHFEHTVLITDKGYEILTSV